MRNSPQPPRRNRFQFWLRTLMLAVILYGGAWVLTIKWGANQLVGEMELEKGSWYRKDFIAKKVKDGQIALEGLIPTPDIYFGGISHRYNRPPPSDSLVPLKITLSVRCPFPFLLFTSEEYTFRTGDNAEKDSKKYIWFFGYKTEVFAADEFSKPFNQIIGDDETIDAK
jgi:hypothetical protein